MAALSHAESWRLYSWWWDSHNSPKNSKWLEEDLTDLDARVKLMIKLIEEDGDSFAMRAEMYYKRRPELIKLVEEFYRTYRALAERYGHATKALGQANRAMSKALDSHACSSPDLMSATLSADSECSTPRILIQSHSCCSANDTYHPSSGLTNNRFHSPPSGVCIEEFDPFMRKRGLKQVYEMFSSSGGAKSPMFGEKREPEGPIIPEQAMKVSESELCGRSEEARIEVNRDHLDEFMKLQTDCSHKVDKENTRDQGKSEEMEILIQGGDEPPQDESHDGSLYELEVSWPKDRCLEQKQAFENCILHLKEDNENLHLIVEQMQKEVEDLKVSLQDEHLQVLQAEAALESLKAQNSRLQEKLETALAEKQKGSKAAKEKDMRIRVLEENLQQADCENHKLMGEFSRKSEEADELHLSIEEERRHCRGVEADLLALEELCSQCERNMEVLTLRKQEAEQKVCMMEEEMCTLQAEKLRLKDMQSKLEHELLECSISREALQEENSFLKERVHDLEVRQLDVLGQMDALKMKSKSLQEMLAALQEENSILKDICGSLEKEKALLLEKLQNMEAILDRNDTLANSLEDANLVIEDLKRKLNALGESNRILQESNLFLEVENSTLICKKDDTEEEMRKLQEKNLFLANSLRHENCRVKEMEGKLSSFEETCCSLSEEKILLCNELNALILQVESFGRNIKSLDGQYVELCNKQLSLEAEKDLALAQISELQVLLNIERKDKKLSIDALYGQVSHLSEEVKTKEAELLSKEKELLEVAIESFVFQRFLSDLKDRNVFICSGDLKARPLEKRLSKVDETDWKSLNKTIKQMQDCSSELEDERYQYGFAVEKLGSNSPDGVSFHEKEWEEFLEDCHLAVVSSMLFKEKARELMETHEDLGMANDKDLVMKCDIKEEENKQLKAELDECRTLVLSLKDCISYWEDSIHLSRKHHIPHIQEIEFQDDAEIKCEIGHQTFPSPKLSTELRKLIIKLDDIQKDVMENKTQDVVAPVRHLQMPDSDSQVQRTFKGADGGKEIHVISEKDHARREGNTDRREEMTLKDIQLDHIASITRHNGSTVPFGLPGLIDIEKGCLSAAKDEVEQKLVGSGKLVDGMELALKRHVEKDWRDSAKRLSIDADRLSTLQTRVWELKRKSGILERSISTKSLAFDAAKEQLKHVEDSILQLVDANAEVMRKVRTFSSSFENRRKEEMEEVHNQKERMFFECSRRESRKIGKLEMELQELQCILLGIEEGLERQRTRAARKGSRVVLNDYLFRRSERKKFQQFCGCVETKDYCHVKKGLVKERSF